MDKQRKRYKIEKSKPLSDDLFDNEVPHSDENELQKFKEEDFKQAEKGWNNESSARAYLGAITYLYQDHKGRHGYGKLQPPLEKSLKNFLTN